MLCIGSRNTGLILILLIRLLLCALRGIFHSILELSLSADIQGATLMAIGSATPEFFTSLIAVFLYSDNMDLNPAPSTIVGSGMFNVSFVTGFYVIISNIFHEQTKPNMLNMQHINAFALHRDIIMYIISVIALYIFYDISSPEQMSGFEGLCLVLLWIAYVIVLIHSARCKTYCACDPFNQSILLEYDPVIVDIHSDNDDNHK
eukprot:720355_1